MLLQSAPTSLPDRTSTANPSTVSDELSGPRFVAGKDVWPKWSWTDPGSCFGSTAPQGYHPLSAGQQTSIKPERWKVRYEPNTCHTIWIILLCPWVSVYRLVCDATMESVKKDYCTPPKHHQYMFSHQLCLLVKYFKVIIINY